MSCRRHLVVSFQLKRVAEDCQVKRDRPARYAPLISKLRKRQLARNLKVSLASQLPGAHRSRASSMMSGCEGSAGMGAAPRAFVALNGTRPVFPTVCTEGSLLNAEWYACHVSLGSS